MTINLSQLIPQDESYSVPDKDGKNHEFKMFVPYALTMAQSEAQKGKKKLDAEYQLLAIESLLKPQHDYMNREWIADNISLPHQNFIYGKIVQKINEGTAATVADSTAGQKGKKKLSSLLKW
jgi:hypothetical protein